MPIPDPFRNPTGVISRVRNSIIEGGAAGVHVLVGIDVQFDRLIQVVHVASAVDVLSSDDLTGEFTLGSADDRINNTGGTNTTNGLLFVTWIDHDWGEFEDAPWQE